MRHPSVETRLAIYSTCRRDHCFILNMVGLSTLFTEVSVYGSFLTYLSSPKQLKLSQWRRHLRHSWECLLRRSVCLRVLRTTVFVFRVNPYFWIKSCSIYEHCIWIILDLFVFSLAAKIVSVEKTWWVESVCCKSCSIYEHSESI